jgi:hypothetical protein
VSITSDALVAAALLRCYWPSTNPPLTTAETLALADQEIAGQLFPQLIAAQGDYYLSTLDYAITAGQEYYRLPARAFGPVRDLIYVEMDGTEISMPVFSLEDIGRPERLRRTFRAQYQACVDGDFLRLSPVPTVTRGDKLRIRYFRAPSTLALASTSSTLVAVDPALPGISTVANPASWIVGTRLDILSSGNAHQTLVDNAAISSIFGGTIFTFGAAPTGPFALLAAGDYAIAAGTTPVAQIPDVMIPLLVHRVAAAMLTANGELEAASREEQIASQRASQAAAMLNPRVMAEPDYIVTRNSALRRGMW